MSPLELIQDAETLAEMSTLEQLYAGGQVAILGMFIVFTILLILLLTVKAIEKFAADKTPEDDSQSAGAGAKKSVQKVEDHDREKVSEKEEDLDPKILAAITASLQSYYREKAGKFRIIRVQKKSRQISPWMREIKSEEEAHDLRNGNREVK